MITLLIVFAGAALVEPSGQAPCERARALVEQAHALGRSEAATTADHERRVALYREALAACPSDADAQNGLGDAYEALAELKAATDAYLKAIQLRSNSAYPYFGLGDVARTQGRADDALFWYRQGLRFAPDDEETLARVRELTKDDPPGVIGSRSIAPTLEANRGPGVMASVFFSERLIPFAFDSVDLQEGAHAQIREIAHAVYEVLGYGTRGPGVLISAGAPVIEVVGPTDTRGTDEYNHDLGLRRAQAVADELARSHRIPRERIRVTARGESQPVCTEDTETCHARNRRVEIKRPE